jgi:predicted nucleotidyltransferase
MTSADAVVQTLRAHERELKAAGVLSMSVFGSVARGEDQDGSDVDVLVKLEDDPDQSGFAYVGRLERLTLRLAAMLGRPVDIVTEPVRKDRLRRRIERDRILAF